MAYAGYVMGCSTDRLGSDICARQERWRHDANNRLEPRRSERRSTQRRQF
jgi:hypothetical protein